ncbi:hypothetical protein SODALDRAFT_363625 [Sodiomyces alkalinus F11]|uniref:Uncharacterized protein n=1 Tax=Sodiomyces alkalinus (strain CBS 110278 / VKM F-3762 / F11) TaxID=1314773 RepID=A0A3N2PKT9_SODAK|nr:hypothetical protein SODALDRAFT_363625 [Sodiomyces alkalinus F11]ROT34936.1 hypothetical protein SODALDRAFT_363625 [Sodiomyces alkalinus F11]
MGPLVRVFCGMNDLGSAGFWAVFIKPCALHPLGPMRCDSYWAVWLGLYWKISLWPFVTRPAILMGDQPPDMAGYNRSADVADGTCRNAVNLVPGECAKTTYKTYLHGQGCFISDVVTLSGNVQELADCIEVAPQLPPSSKMNAPVKASTTRKGYIPPLESHVTSSPTEPPRRTRPGGRDSRFHVKDRTGTCLRRWFDY